MNLGLPHITVERLFISIATKHVKPRNGKYTSSLTRSKDVIISLEFFDHVASVLDGGLTIQAEERHLSPSKKVFEDVQHASHLTEDETPVLLYVQSVYQVGKDAHFCTVSRQSEHFLRY